MRNASKNISRGKRLFFGLNLKKEGLLTNFLHYILAHNLVLVACAVRRVHWVAERLWFAGQGLLVREIGTVGMGITNLFVHQALSKGASEKDNRIKPDSCYDQGSAYELKWAKYSPYLWVSHDGFWNSVLGALWMMAIIPSLAASLTNVSNLLGAGSLLSWQLLLSL